MHKCINKQVYIHVYTHTYTFTYIYGHLDQSLVGCGEALQNSDEPSEVQRVSLSFSNCLSLHLSTYI